jgi:hypothetical protein
MSTKPLMVKVSPAFKEAIDAAAKAADLNMSDLVRVKVAEAIGYDLSKDDALDGRGRPRKYESEEARRKARSKAETERQRQRRAIREAAERKAREEGAASLEEWLRRKGLLTDDEPVAASA